MITATYRYYVDWDNDRSFVDPAENISAYVFEASWEYGRDFASQLSGCSKAGSCRILLDNADGRFSPFNVSSPFHGQMLPGRRVCVTMQIGAGAEVTMWQGYLEAINPSPGIVVGVSTAELVAYGVLASRCLQGRLSIPMHIDIKTGAAVDEVLDAAGFATADRAMKLVGHKTESIYRRYAIVARQDLVDGLKRLAECRAGLDKGPAQQKLIQMQVAAS